MCVTLQKKKMSLWSGQLSLNDRGITMDAWKPKNQIYRNFVIAVQFVEVIAMGIAMLAMCIAFM